MGDISGRTDEVGALEKVAYVLCVKDVAEKHILLSLL